MRRQGGVAQALVAAVSSREGRLRQCGRVSVMPNVRVHAGRPTRRPRRCRARAGRCGGPKSPGGAGSPACRSPVLPPSGTRPRPALSAGMSFGPRIAPSSNSAHPIERLAGEIKCCTEVAGIHPTRRHHRSGRCRPAGAERRAVVPPRVRSKPRKPALCRVAPKPVRSAGHRRGLTRRRSRRHPSTAPPFPRAAVISAYEGASDGAPNAGSQRVAEGVSGYPVALFSAGGTSQLTSLR